MAATQRGLIVFGDYRSETIIAMIEEGRVFLKYRSPKLKRQHGLDTDSCGNIYIAGSESNNVHVLTNSGQLIRVIERIFHVHIFSRSTKRRELHVCAVQKYNICISFLTNSDKYVTIRKNQIVFMQL